MLIKKLALSSVLLALVACGPTDPLAGSNTDTSQDGISQTGHTYRYGAISGDVESFDPHYMQSGTEFRILNDLFEPLVIQDENGAPVPGAALSWAANADFSVWTFELRTDAKWSNGDSVTAHDFVYAWQRSVELGDANPYSWYWAKITGIQNARDIVEGIENAGPLGVSALSDYRLQVTLEKGLAYFPKVTTMIGLAPLHKATIESQGSNWIAAGSLVGNGAYVLTSLSDDGITLTANENYHSAEAVYMTQVETKFFDSIEQSVAAFEAGMLDQSLAPFGQQQTLQQQYPGEALVTPKLCTYYYQFNLNDADLQDVNVRKALVYATDRTSIIENILQGGQMPAYTLTPEYTHGFSAPDQPWVGLTQAERNTQAQQLMANTAYTAENPLSLELYFNTSSGHRAIAEALKASWESVLPVTVSVKDSSGVDEFGEPLNAWHNFLTNRAAGNYQIARAGWCGDYNEPSTFLHTYKTESEYNDSNFSDATFDNLIADAMQSTDSVAKYTQAEQLLDDQSILLPLYFYSEPLLLKSDIQGYPINNIEQNIYSKDLYR